LFAIYVIGVVGGCYVANAFGLIVFKLRCPCQDVMDGW